MAEIRAVSRKLNDEKQRQIRDDVDKLVKLLRSEEVSNGIFAEVWDTILGHTYTIVTHVANYPDSAQDADVVKYAVEAIRMDHHRFLQLCSATPSPEQNSKLGSLALAVASSVFGAPLCRALTQLAEEAL